MKLSIILLAFFIMCNSFSAQNLWEIKKDSANFAVLICDYITYEFEKANFSVHKANENFEDKLPIESIQNPPADYGDITFLYSVNSDSLFSGEIIWQGVGSIVFPKTFISADSFSNDQVLINEPISFEYLESNSSVEYKAKADSAWESVKNLDIVNAFSQYPYRVGIYLYQTGSGVPVDTGFVDFIGAKWVIFLYINKPELVSVNENNEISKEFNLSQNYPNPFNPTTIIEYSLAKSGNTKIVVYDVLGTEIKTLSNKFQLPGNYKIEFNANELSSGIYFYSIINGNFISTKKMILIK